MFPPIGPLKNGKAREQYKKKNCAWLSIFKPQENIGGRGKKES